MGLRGGKVISHLFSRRPELGNYILRFGYLSNKICIDYMPSGCVSFTFLLLEMYHFIYKEPYAKQCPDISASTELITILTSLHSYQKDRETEHFYRISVPTTQGVRRSQT